MKAFLSCICVEASPNLATLLEIPASKSTNLLFTFFVRKIHIELSKSNNGSMTTTLTTIIRGFEEYSLQHDTSRNVCFSLKRESRVDRNRKRGGGEPNNPLSSGSMELHRSVKAGS